MSKIFKEPEIHHNYEETEISVSEEFLSKYEDELKELIKQKKEKEKKEDIKNIKEDIMKTINSNNINNFQVDEGILQGMEIFED